MSERQAANNRARPLPAVPTVEKPSTEFFKIPEGTPNNLIMGIFTAGENVADLKDKKEATGNAQLEITQRGDKRRITQRNRAGTEEITVEVSDINALMGSNKPAKKLFVLALIEMNKQLTHNGEVVVTGDHNYITFPLKQLVTNGSYSTIRSAREGFYAGRDVLTSLKIKGRVSKHKYTTEDEDGNKEEHEIGLQEIDKLRVLFTGGDIENGQCVLFLNHNVNWNFLAQYFTTLPLYYFALPNKAGDLIYYIFYRARIATRKIQERGYFTISLRTIQNTLQLPSEIGNTRPRQTIREPIEKAIEQIEAAHMNTYPVIFKDGEKLEDKLEFSLSLHCDGYDTIDEAPITDYLERGYLKVEMKGDFAKYFIEISKNTAKKIGKKAKNTARSETT